MKSRAVHPERMMRGARTLARIAAMPAAVTRTHRTRRRSRRGVRRHSRFDDIAVNVLAAAWLARGAWRVHRGRLPWQPRSSRRRRG
jgi:hypothetical protein